jgi:hypothetical protein
MITKEEGAPMNKREVYEIDGREVWVYPADGGGWRVALNPREDCHLWQFHTKKRATEKALELVGKP